eukprot:TRINITY_DN6716_c0_g1_i1.p1 TRINITY_DN6716_c0_g1~~TRINITY_DN6716_c0_g1_i1.p1  ORF type:complete len:405 (-),score=78.50 TRINITY_DN6716_c0_g1_i1:298-1512(-)
MSATSVKTDLIRAVSQMPRILHDMRKKGIPGTDEEKVYKASSRARELITRSDASDEDLRDALAEIEDIVQEIGMGSRSRSGSSVSKISWSSEARVDTRNSILESKVSQLRQLWEKQATTGKSPGASEREEVSKLRQELQSSFSCQRSDEKSKELASDFTRLCDLFDGRGRPSSLETLESFLSSDEIDANASSSRSQAGGQTRVAQAPRCSIGDKISSMFTFQRVDNTDQPREGEQQLQQQEAITQAQQEIILELPEDFDLEEMTDGSFKGAGGSFLKTGRQSIQRLSVESEALAQAIANIADLADAQNEDFDAIAEHQGFARENAAQVAEELADVALMRTRNATRTFAVVMSVGGGLTGAAVGLPLCASLAIGGGTAAVGFGIGKLIRKHQEVQIRALTSEGSR